MIAGTLDYHLGYSVNERGTRVSLHTCRGCGGTFTVVPASDVPFGGCLGDDCSTYDLGRDAEVYFLPDAADLIEP